MEYSLLFCRGDSGTILTGIIESIMARFRFLKVPQLLNGALVLSVIAIIFMVVFER